MKNGFHLKRNLKALTRGAGDDLIFPLSSAVLKLNPQAIDQLKRKKKAHKYKASTAIVDGIRFDSKLEAQRYGELKMLQCAGSIRGLRVHVPFLLVVHDVEITTYEADFVYEQNGQVIVEDTKGFLTPEYKIKRALMLALHGVQIKEVRRGKR